MSLRYPKMRQLVAKDVYEAICPDMQAYYREYVKDVDYPVSFVSFLRVAIFLEKKLHRPFRKLAVKKALQYKEKEKENKDPATQDLPKNK